MIITHSIYGVFSSGHSYIQKEDIYWKPGVTKEQLYNQMSQKKYQEIPVHCVTVKHQLGEGEFGQVCYGEWLSPYGPVEVAVKVSTDADSEDRVKLLQEAAIMGQFTHPRVVRMYGVITCVEPVSCVLVSSLSGLYTKLTNNIELGIESTGSELNIEKQFLCM